MDEEKLIRLDELNRIANWGLTLPVRIDRQRIANYVIERVKEIIQKENS